MWQINALCFAKQFLPMLAVQLDLKPEATAPRHGDLPFSALRCGVPSIPPALGKGRKVTRGWFFIPTHSNPAAVKMLAPECWIPKSLSPSALGLYSWEQCPYLLCPCPSCSSRTWPPNTQSLWPATVSANRSKTTWQLFIHSNIYKGIKWIFLWSHCRAAEEASALLTPKPGAGDEGPVMAARMLQQL